MNTVTRHSPSGTLLAVSVQCTKAPEADELATGANVTTALDRFVNKFGRQRVSQQTAADDLFGWRFGALSRKLLIDEIQAGLAFRNSGNGPTMMFRLICEIEYDDGARMTTIVGMLHSVEDTHLVEKCNFDEIEFMTAPLSPIRIDVPKLTVREFRRLESQLPLNQDGELQLGTIPVSEARGFQKMYRYLPSFAVLES
jgi:hypothetical protein